MIKRQNEVEKQKLSEPSPERRRECLCVLKSSIQVIVFKHKKKEMKRELDANIKKIDILSPSPSSASLAAYKSHTINRQMHRLQHAKWLQSYKYR